MRMTKDHIQGMFNRLVKAMGKEHDRGNYKGMHLENIAEYGGYLVYEYYGDGSVRYPFGLERRNAREIYLSMAMTAQALENLK